MPRCSQVATILVVLTVVFLSGCYSPTAGSPIPTYDGARLYRENCASCHGRTGDGDGPLVAGLKQPPANLRVLSVRNNGQFPRLAIIRQIDGRDLSVAHGSREMPVWGWQFRQADNDKRDPNQQASARIDALVDHLATLQSPGG